MEYSKKQKKAFKRLAAKYLAREPQEIKIPGVLLHGINGDHDYADHTFLMDAATEKEALEKLERHYPVYGMDAPRVAWDCTGAPFCGPATVKEVAENRQLVKLHISYDV